MKGKRGFAWLEKSVLELVLTIIGILLVLAVVVYAFGLVSTAQVKRNAQTSLDILESRANSLQEGEMVVAKLPGLCKEGSDKNCDWFVTGWSKDDVKIPENYLLKNVICVCQGDPDYATRVCSYQDSCKEVKNSVGIKVGPDSFDDISTDNEGRPIKVPKDYPALAFKSNLIQVKIEKINGVVSFTKM